MQAADFLCELLFVSDDHLVLSNTVDFNREELPALIDYICTNKTVCTYLQSCVIVKFINLFYFFFIFSCVLRARYQIK